MEQIIIIGNGFDKACGLASSYSDYFYSRFSEFEDKNQLVLPTIIDKIDKGEEENILCSIWDILFAAFHDEGVPTPLWQDVEAILAQWFTPTITVGKNHNFDSAISDWDHHFKDMHRTIEQQVQNTISNKTVEWTLAKYIKHKHPIQKVHTEGQRSSDLNLDDLNYKTERSHFLNELPKYFLEELYIFEQSFAIYLLNCIEKSNDYYQKADFLYKEICCTDTGTPLSKQKNSVISFNYTTPLLKSTNDEIRNSIYLQRNIHGTLPEEKPKKQPDGSYIPSANIVFGVDGYLNRNNPRLEGFTKTHRILRIPRQELPDEMKGRHIFDMTNLHSIKIYGHSLGEADYSYFQSLFDKIDLYNSNTLLYFLYSKKYETSPETVESLINRYAQTLPAEKGRILMHKLLFEDRLKIMPISNKHN